MLEAVKPSQAFRWGLQTAAGVRRATSPAGLRSAGAAGRWETRTRCSSRSETRTRTGLDFWNTTEAWRETHNSPAWKLFLLRTPPLLNQTSELWREVVEEGLIWYFIWTKKWGFAYYFIEKWLFSSSPAQRETLNQVCSQNRRQSSCRIRRTPQLCQHLSSPSFPSKNSISVKGSWEIGGLWDEKLWTNKKHTSNASVATAQKENRVSISPVNTKQRKREILIIVNN